MRPTEQILSFAWEEGAKIALIGGRLIYSLFKHLHGYFFLKKPNQVLDPTVPDPKQLSAKSGHAYIFTDAAGRLTQHTEAPRTLEVG